MRCLLMSVGLALGAVVATHAGAQANYPSHTVRIVVPAAAGGSNSILAQVLGSRLQAAWGQAFYVDNRGGAGGAIGVNIVAKAPPDGYTLLLTFGGPVATGLPLLNNLPYDPARDLAPVARVAEVPLVLVASPRFPVHSVKDVVDYAKSKPGELKASINSYGAMGHLLTEQFRLDNQITINEIPYKGTGEALPNIISGAIDVAVDTVPALQELIKAGKLNALAVTSASRTDVLPQVPTFAELGERNMEATTWFALFAPAGTPKPIIDKLAAEVERILKMPDVVAQLARQGAVVNYAPPAETATFVQQETEKWTRVIKSSAMKAE